MCLPARDEAATIGAIVGRLVGHPLVDEVLVVDDHSTDRTADAAAAEGATVVRAAEVLAEHGDGPGKGQALWKAVASTSGDLVAFCDADVRDFDERFVVGLLGPLLLDAGRRLREGVLPAARRRAPPRRRPGHRARRPPDAAPAVPRARRRRATARRRVRRPPRAARVACRSSRATASTSACSIDVTRAVGPERIVQVDLGRRIHRNRPLDELGPDGDGRAPDGAAARRRRTCPPTSCSTGPTTTPSPCAGGNARRCRSLAWTAGSFTASQATRTPTPPLHAAIEDGGEPLALLRRCAEALVPAFADGCELDLRDDRGIVRIVAGARPRGRRDRASGPPMAGRRRPATRSSPCSPAARPG